MSWFLPQAPRKDSWNPLSDECPLMVTRGPLAKRHRDTSQWGPDARRTMWLEGYGFRPHIPTSREGREAGKGVQSSAGKDLINYGHVNETLIKILRQWGQGASSEYTCHLGGWDTSTPWGQRLPHSGPFWTPPSLSSSGCLFAPLKL